MRLVYLGFVFSLITLQSQGQAQSEPGSLFISLKDKSWALQIVAPGFVVTQNVTKADGRQYLLATNDSSGYTLSVTLEKVSGEANDGCRENFRARTKPGGPFELADINQSELASMPILEYMIPEANKVPVRQKNIFGCLVKEDVYADIHLSKAAFQEADEPRLKAILSSARFQDISDAQSANSRPASSAALFAEGSRHFLLNEFDKAIGPYQKALDRERTTPTLDASNWRVLVDNLAMSYGITGNLTAAGEVLNYGLSKDPEYPMFYFILGDVAAERGDFDNTMRYLRRALKFRANLIPGEKLPDPMTDDSFKAFRKNDEFKKLAAEFVASP